jgi:hypothetical protein
MAPVASPHVPSASAGRKGRCRCEECRGLGRLYARQWKALEILKAGGEPASRVPTNGVMTHVRALERAGLSRREISRRAGVAPGTITRLMKPGTRASAITIRLLRSVEP